MKNSAYVVMFIFFTLSQFAGINLTTTTAQDNQSEQGEAIEFKTLAKNFSSGVHETKNMVIRTREEWATIWEVIHFNTSEKPELPDVDFDNRMIIAVFAGDKPTPGHDIVVLETLKSGKKKMRVSYKETKPGENCLHPQVLTQPYHVIETARAKKVSFNLFQEVKDCHSQ